MFDIFDGRVTLAESTFGRLSMSGFNTGAPRDKKVDVGNYKAIQVFKSFDNTREQFVQWNDKLLNAISRIHKGSREIREMLKACNQEWAQGNTEVSDKIT